MHKKIILDKKIISKKLEGDNIVTVYEETVPRYSLQKYQADCDIELENLKEYCSFNLRGKFSGVNNAKMEEKGSFEEDAQAFLDYCKESNLAPYVVNVFDHSGCSFSFSELPEDLKNYSKRHGWDSYVCGFVGIDKEAKVKPEDCADMLSDIWEGYIDDYSIFDNLEEEVVDSFLIYGSLPCEEKKRIEEEIKEKYNLEIEL